MNKTWSRLFWVMGLSLAVTNCGSESDSDPTEAFNEAEGIYSLDTRSRNDAACSEGGESLLTDTSDRYVLARSASVFGFPLLNLVSCASPADCRDKSAKMDAMEGYLIDFSYTVSEADDAGNFIGEGASTGFGRDGMCEEAEVTKTIVTLNDTSLSVRQEITIAEPFAQDVEGYCTTTAAQAAVEGASCSALEMLTATFAEAL
jgi:hypothetical protein